MSETPIISSMNINRKKQSQFELFPGVLKNGNYEIGKSAHLTKDLTLSLENIIVLCIISVMVVILFFSFGVEKGKRVAMLSGEQSQSETPGTKDKASESESIQGVSTTQQIVKGVIPGDIPENVIKDGQLAFRPPIEKVDGEEQLFTIQVASFKLKKNAQREAQRLKGGGHKDIFVIAKGSYSIVCVGKFAKRIEAKRFSNTLKNRYNDCLVRRL